MMWLLTRPIVWPLKTAVYSVSAGYRTGRFFGYRRVTVFLVGVAVGLLVAPVPGRELRARLMERLAPAPPLPLPAGTGGPYPSVMPDAEPSDIPI